MLAHSVYSLMGDTNRRFQLRISTFRVDTSGRGNREVRSLAQVGGKGSHGQMGSCMVLNTEESVTEVGTMSNRMFAGP